jgi:hypothetical protein
LTAATALWISLIVWPVPERARVDDVLAHRLQQRAGALDVGRLAAGHDRQRAVGGLGRRARDRRVEERVAFLGQSRADGAGVGRRDRRHVDEQRPGAAAAAAPAGPRRTSSTSVRRPPW